MAHAAKLPKIDEIVAGMEFTQVDSLKNPQGEVAAKLTELRGDLGAHIVINHPTRYRGVVSATHFPKKRGQNAATQQERHYVDELTLLGVAREAAEAQFANDKTQITSELDSRLKATAAGMAPKADALGARVAELTERLDTLGTSLERDAADPNFAADTREAAAGAAASVHRFRDLVTNLASRTLANGGGKKSR